MDDPQAEMTQENDIVLGNIEEVAESPHLFNKIAVSAKLLFDQPKGYYSSRIGLNLYSLANADYTMAFEIIWKDSNVDKNNVNLGGISSIETIHKISQKVFNNYSRMIVQFTKSQNIGNNYLYIDIEMEMKSGVSYPAELQTYILCYQSDVPSNLYDSLLEIENGKIIINAEIDMGDKAIIGIKEDTVDTGAVNYKQLKAFEQTLMNLINENKRLVM